MKKIAILLMVFIFVTACSKVIDNKISQLLLQGNTTPLTRYSGDGGFEEGDAVGVYVVQHGANAGDHLLGSGNYADNRRFINSNVSSLGLILKPNAGDEVSWSDKHTFDIYSYFPYSESVNSVGGHPFSVNIDQSVAANYYESDFLWAKVPNIVPASSPVQTDYKHLLSEVNIYIYPGDGYTHEDLKNILTGVDLKNVISDASIDLSSGVITKGTQKSTIPTYRKISNDIIFSAIIIPQTISNSNVFAHIKVGDVSYPISFDMVAQSGKSYKIKITIDKGFNNSEVTLNGITSWDFIDGPSQNLPIINPINKNIKTYCTVGFGSYADVCFDGATIGSFTCESGRGNDYLDYAHNPNKRANITDNMDMEVRFKNLTSSAANGYKVYVFVDWNNDGDFPDQNEFIGFKDITAGASNSIQKLSYTISIPIGAKSPTTMRILCTDATRDYVPDGCGAVTGTVYDVPVYF